MSTFQNPDAAIEALAERLFVVSPESSVEVAGRVLAQDLVTDRDSPAANVSAMDGYAIRMSELCEDVDIPVRGIALPGAAPPDIVDGCVAQIFTGAVVPKNADAVVQREHAVESEGSIRFLPVAMKATLGTNIRAAGENIRGGEVFLKSGVCITAPRSAAMVNFGIESASVFQKVRVAIVTTGDEVVGGDTDPMFGRGKAEPQRDPPTSQSLSTWQIRNSNRFALQSLFSEPDWLATPTWIHVSDQRDLLASRLREMVAHHDAVILTGGVSAGDHDYVPDVVREIGGEVIFHKLPVRPGKPILGAVMPEGKLILGLPGNPVSATMGGRRFAMPLLSKMSGQNDWRDQVPCVRIENAGGKTLPLYWMRGVRLTDRGSAVPVIGKGSGDLVTLAQTDGFIEMPPGASGEGPWPYWSW